ncbi:MAG TPA: transcriptional repressor [Sandaracinaceae bacterium LLY-WYZ-13_1]|nr:transcriptional repressor [Sandaracinaceae bacterium LLY-WYZ-13_1]
MTAEDTSARNLKQVLRDAGLRATSARAAVLRCLIEAQRPLTHADVCERLASLGYDRATLYRNLMDLTDVGLALRTDLGDHLWRFELAGRDEHEDTVHPHFVCSECGTVRCLPDDALDVRPVRGVPRSVKRKRVEIQIRGLCNACD